MSSHPLRAAGTVAAGRHRTSRRSPRHPGRRWIPPLVVLAALAVGVFMSTRVGAAEPGVAVLLVDTDHPTGTVDERIYGHFLEHINHSVVDGLYAEQVRGQGFEGNDFADYWQTFGGEHGNVALVAEKLGRGERSVRIEVRDGTAGIRQGRAYVAAAQTYDGSVWLKSVKGAANVSLRVKSSEGEVLADIPLRAGDTNWREAPFRFVSPKTDTQAVIEIAATGTGTVLVDFVSLMRADARANGKLRPDLLAALKALKPPFIRWPGGSYASVYKWKDGIGPAVSRAFHPNPIWGGYSDYYGFGTDEFLELCRQVGADPLIVLSATSTNQAELEYAMDWVHYLLDPVATAWGRQRATNGHPAPYRVPYIQIDNEPMNHDLTPEQYAAIVNAYGRRLRSIAPAVKIVACGQKRSNDMAWSEKLIDLAGANFDILGCHNYEYEPENYATGVRRIKDYLESVCDYVRNSSHPAIKVAVLEWGLCRTYDWRAGLHTAGILVSYEKLSPALDMSCPALLMRNTTDDPDWRAWIYHDHVSWFAGSGYVTEKLFRDHFQPQRYAFASGTFKDIPRRADFFDGISQMKPEGWTPNTVDAIATGSFDGRHFVIKAVNYDGTRHTLLTRFQGSRAPAAARVRIFTLTARLDDENSLIRPDRIHPVESSRSYASDMAFDLAPYTVAVVDVAAE